MNKKASVQDVGWAMIFFFVAVILFLVATYAFTTYTNKAKTITSINSSAVTMSAMDDAVKNTERFDYVSVAILFGWTLAIIISGWLVAGNQLFMWLYFLFLAVIILVSAVFSYVWSKVYSVTSFTSLIDAQFPIANHILSNFPVYMTVIGFIGLVVMFAKPQGGMQ